jgi:hypothetical protein
VHPLFIVTVVIIIIIIIVIISIDCPVSWVMKSRSTRRAGNAESMEQMNATEIW